MPQEIEIINSFKRDLPDFVDQLIRENPLKLSLRVFKRKYVPQMERLEFKDNPCNDNDEFYDATIYCNTPKGMIGHPVTINITKLIQIVNGKPTTSYPTEWLKTMVHPDNVKEFDPQRLNQKDIPPILLIGKGFGRQLIDGNHRVLHSHYAGRLETPVIEVTKEDLTACLECNEFSVIIAMFLDLIRIFERDNPHNN